jgi:hypothetical protein
MAMNVGQINDLLRELLEYPVVYLDDYALDSELDKTILLNTLEDIRRLDRDLIISRGSDDNISLSIPETERDRAEWIIENGGWGKAILAPHLKKLEVEKTEMKRRLDAEERSWIATERHARNANIIAWLALIVAAVALAFELFWKN